MNPQHWVRTDDDSGAHKPVINQDVSQVIVAVLGSVAVAAVRLHILSQLVFSLQSGPQSDHKQPWIVQISGGKFPGRNLHPNRPK